MSLVSIGSFLGLVCLYHYLMRLKVVVELPCCGMANETADLAATMLGETEHGGRESRLRVAAPVVPVSVLSLALYTGAGLVGEHTRSRGARHLIVFKTRRAFADSERGS